MTDRARSPSTPLVTLDVGTLRAVIRGEVERALEAQTNGHASNARLAYTEAEAAALIGVRPHVLRDARRRGEVHAKLVGKRYIYTLATLKHFLESDKPRTRKRAR